MPRTRRTETHVRTLLTTASAALTGATRRPTHKQLAAAIAAAHPEVDAAWWAACADGLLFGSRGWVDDDLADALGGMTEPEARAHPGLRGVAERSARRERLRFASFDPARLVYAATAPKRGGAYVVDGDAVWPTADAVHGPWLLGGEVTALARRGGRWRITGDGWASRPFDAVETAVVHGDALWFVVRAARRRRVQVGRRCSTTFDEVELPAWSGDLVQVGPDTFFEARVPEASRLFFAGRRGRRTTLVDSAGDTFVAAATHEVLDHLGWWDGAPAYRARIGGRWHVVGPDGVGPAYDEVPRVTFDRGAPVYRARRGAAWHTVIGRAEGEPFDEIGPATAMDGVHYTARRGAQWFAVADARVFGPYDEVEWLEPFGADPERPPVWATRGRRGGKWTVAVDGVHGPARDAIPEVVDGPWSIGRDGDQVFVDGPAGSLGPFGALAPLGPDQGMLRTTEAGEVVFVRAAPRGKWALQVGDRAFPPADEVLDGGWERDGAVAFAARTGDRWTVHLGDEARGPLPRRPVALWDEPLTALLDDDSTVEVG